MTHRRNNKKLISLILLLLLAVALCPSALAEAPVPAARVWIEGNKSTASQRIAVQVCVSVDSEELREDQLALSYHVYASDGRLLVFEGNRIALERWVDGTIMNIPVEILLSSLPGVFPEKEVDVVFDIVNETGGYWFSTSPGVSFTSDTVQYRGHFALKVRESIARAFHRPVILLVHIVLWTVLVVWFMTIRKRKKILPPPPRKNRG